MFSLILFKQKPFRTSWLGLFPFIRAVYDSQKKKKEMSKVKWLPKTINHEFWPWQTERTTNGYNNNNNNNNINFNGKQLHSQCWKSRKNEVPFGYYEIQKPYLVCIYFRLQMTECLWLSCLDQEKRKKKAKWVYELNELFVSFMQHFNANLRCTFCCNAIAFSKDKPSQTKPSQAKPNQSMCKEFNSISSVFFLSILFVFLSPLFALFVAIFFRVV